MYHVQTISNITCIEELRKIINFNLITYVRYDFNCKNCNKIKNELIDIDNYEITYYYICLRIYNNKLMEEYGLFWISDNGRYFKVKNNNNCTKISEKEFFNLIKVGSVISEMRDQASDKINKIKEKFYQVNLIQIVNGVHYYLIERPTLTKPARKNN